MIELEHVTKHYGNFAALDDVSFCAHPGRITGFLGPNGAGKSTAMRILVGLTSPDHGTATVGQYPYIDIPSPARHVGVLLDASAQHAGRTGREVLILSTIALGLPTARAEEMLTLVGLKGAADRRVGAYSLGMRQRLGIANALIGDPSVLVLDEPANGLDPSGIRWMRSLLRDYATEGGTVLLSSHLLNEVELIADDIILIHRGQIAACGSKAELLATTGTFVRAESPGELSAVLDRTGIRATVAPDGGVHTDADPLHVGRVTAAAGVVLTELRPRQGTGLEEIFMQMTAEDDPASPRAEGAAR